MFLEELTWQQFSSLPNITKLPLHEQERHYRIYLNDVTMQRFAMIQEQIARAEVEALAQASANGGGGLIVQDEGLPSGCIELTANTFDSRYFEVIVGTSTETTYTADWGDGTIGEGTLLAEDTATISHEYANDSQEYIIRLCFANASAVTSLELEGDD